MLFYVKKAAPSAKAMVEETSRTPQSPSVLNDEGEAVTVEGAALAAAMKKAVKNPAKLPDGSQPVYKTSLFGDFLKPEEAEREAPPSDDVQHLLMELKAKYEKRIRLIHLERKTMKPRFLLNNNYPDFLCSLKRLIDKERKIKRLYERVVAETLEKAKNRDVSSPRTKGNGLGFTASNSPERS